MKRTKDSRVKARHVSWKEYLLTLTILEGLNAGQALIYNTYAHITISARYALPLVGYWWTVTLIVCLVVSWQWYRAYDKPMRRLSEATKQVAEGDFSVYVEPLHTGDKTDYVDVMFEDFNKMVEALGSLETLKSDFISNVSHEIKTPLSVIQSYAMALQNEKLTPETRKEYSSTIISATESLSALVTNILKLSKLENLEIPPSSEPYDLCRQLSDCALSFENLWEEKNITFEADIEDCATICADASMLEIVWNNLFSNALKFTDPGGTVTLKQTSDSDTIIVSVTDTGCGMNEETKRHIFDKFYQGDTSHSRDGNGLGLTLALKAIELTGGSISVDSTPGAGTKFTVRLKVA